MFSGTDKYNTEFHEFVYGPLVLTATTSCVPISASFILLFFIKNLLLTNQLVLWRVKLVLILLLFKKHCSCVYSSNLVCKHMYHLAMLLR